MVETDVAWVCGTQIMLTLQVASTADGRTPEAVTVPAEVVRASKEGMALRFLHYNPRKLQTLLQSLSSGNPKSD